MVALTVGKLSWWCCCFALMGVVYCQEVDDDRNVQAPSYGNLVWHASQGPRTTIESGDLKSIYEKGGCVKFSGERPFVDVRVFHPRPRTVKTVLLYLPKDAALADIKFNGNTGRKRSQRSFIEINGTGNGEYRVYLGNEEIETEYFRMVAAEGHHEFSICFIRAYDMTLYDYCDCGADCNRNADVVCNGVCREVNPKKCSKVNIALNKPATMSSSFKGSIASCAVNGITGTSFSARGFGTDRTLWNCIHTLPSDSSSTWSVDLGEKYTFRQLILYRRNTEKVNMVGVRIKVDDAECKIITKDDVRNERMDLTCNTAMTGQVVEVSRNRGHLVFCELQIWVCKPGFYGDKCETPCNEHCEKQDVCNGYDGTCPRGCEPGWHAANCGTKCKRTCTARGCDKLTGKCLECPGNYVGDFCEDCDNDHFGEDCSKGCGHCLRKDTPCDRGTGDCELDKKRRVYCEAGYRGDKCTEDCDPDKYGRDCQRQCSGGCQDNECDSVTGHCSCRPGWKGSKCTEQCPDGYYGQNCSSQCGRGCEDGQCHHQSGNCTCGPGFKPDDIYCNAPCDDGYHGNCSTKCGHCAQDPTTKEKAFCVKENGYCPNNKCDQDFMPPLCEDRKPPVLNAGDGCFDMITVIAVNVPVFVIYIISVTFIIIWFRRRRRGSYLNPASASKASDPRPTSNVQEQPNANDEVPQGVVDQFGYIRFSVGPTNDGNGEGDYMEMPSLRPVEQSIYDNASVEQSIYAN